LKPGGQLRPSEACGLRGKIREFLALRGNISAMFVSQFISSNGWRVFDVVWQPYVLSLGAKMSILGGLRSISSIFESGTQILTGRITDLLGRKRMQIFSYVLSIASLVICVLAGTWYYLIPAVILMGLSTSFWVPANASMIAESVGKKERGTAYSIMALTWFIPGLYASIIAGYLAEIWGFRPTLMITLFAETAAFLIFAIFTKETLSKRKSISLRTLFSSFKHIVRPKFGLLRFYVASILDRFAWAFTFPIFFGMLVDTYGLTLLQLGVLSAASSAVTVLSQVPFGKLIDRYGRKPFLMLSEIVGIVCLVGYLISKTFFELLLFYSVMGLVVSTWNPAHRAYISDVVPKEERGMHIGDLNALGGLIAFPSPFIGGILYDRWGFHAPIVVTIIFITVTLLVLSTIKEP